MSRVATDFGENDHTEIDYDEFFDCEDPLQAAQQYDRDHPAEEYDEGLFWP